MTPAPFLLADIGGTNARFALAAADGTISHERSLRCADFGSLVDAAQAYLTVEAPAVRPTAGAFAVASPVSGDIIRMTNLPWEFSISGVRAALALERLEVINDFLAVALSIPALDRGDLVQIGEGTATEGAPVGVLGPGSGLGVSLLVPSSAGWLAFPTEGGHVTMPAISDREAAVLGQLRKSFDHVSAERLLCGPGLVNLYESLSLIDGREPEKLTPAEVTARALDRRDNTCLEALEMFCAMLGSFSGNLALSIGARGGVYVAGGIAPRILSFLSHSRFRKRFVEKGRMRDFLAPVPTWVVTHPYPAFVGLAEKLKSPT
jgi:glucokinase